jgi:hypothetical protein
MEEIDRISDRLDAALRGAGLEGLAPAQAAAGLEEIEREISPYVLPVDLRRFWERISFSSLRAYALSMPKPLDPGAALATHRSNLAPDLFLSYGPPLLFPIASGEGARWSIELSSSAGDGGTVFSHGGDLFRAEYPSFTDLLEVCAELLEEGRFMPVPGEDGAAWLVPKDAHERQDARFDAVAGHPHRDARDVGRDPWGWPEHWLVSAGFDLGDREPLGVTHTIAKLVEAARDGPVRGRIAGRVTRLVVLGDDVRVVVDDGTRTLDVWCPAGTSPWGPVIGGRYEFDVRVERPVPPSPDLEDGHREVQEQALAGRLEPAQAAAERLVGRIQRQDTAAVATDVRPLDQPA